MSIKVVYIVGWGRSGSTILGNILNELEGFTHVGEVARVWENGLMMNRMCGCGAPFQSCERWISIFQEALGGMDEVDALTMARHRDAACANKRVLAHYLSNKVVRVDQSEELCTHLAKLYRGIADVTRSKVVVDSSKSPSYAHLLTTIPMVDLYLVHLVRDARATAYSWAKRVERADAQPGRAEPMEQFGTVAGTRKWLMLNVLAELVGQRRKDRYMRLRYEDFVHDPRHHLSRIAKFVHHETVSSPIDENGYVHLGLNHTVWGNPNRIRSGRVAIRSDDEWRQGLEWHKRIAIEALAWPLQRRYHYAMTSVTTSGS